MDIGPCTGTASEGSKTQLRRRQVPEVSCSEIYGRGLQCLGLVVLGRGAIPHVNMRQKTLANLCLTSKTDP